MAAKPISPIPEPPKDASPALKQFLTAMKEAVEVRLGRRGDPLDEGITRRDLVNSKIAKLGGLGGNLLQPVTVLNDEARIVPPVPIGFSAIGTFGGVTLNWESPFAAYSVHALTEVWRGTSDDPNKRVLIDSSRGAIFFDRIADENAGDYWYWIRFVSEYNREGPFSLVRMAHKLADVGAVMDLISGEIDEGDLAQEFKGKVASIAASYVVKLDPTGAYAAGFGLYNSGGTSEFAVMASRFSVGEPGSGKRRPFIISNGVTYIDTAMIREASIQSGQLGPIGFGKIVGADGQPVVTVAGKLKASAIDVESLRVTDANIEGVLRSGAVASNGQPRWMLDKAGGMTLNGSGAGGRMEIRDTVIKVFDSAGRLRVQLGDLSL
jgi:hypothetical protein